MTSRPVAARPVPAARLAVLLGLVIGLVVLACGTSGPTGPSAAPGNSGAVASGAADSGGPNPTRWPGGTVTAVVALGAADRDIATFLATYQAAVAKSDLKAMWGAVDGFVKTAESLLPNVDRLDEFGPTKPLAAQYRASIPPAIAAAKKVRDAITAGDAATVNAGSLELIAALQTYSGLRSALAAWVAQSAFQQKILLQ